MNIITYNIRSFRGGGGPGSASDEGTFREQLIERMAQELDRYSPDILCLQEVQTLEPVEELSRRLEMKYVHFEGGDKYGAWPLGIGGALLTRCPIMESRSCPIEGDRPEQLFTRFWGRVLIETPMGTCAVHGAHLHHVESSRRLGEIEHILEAVSDDVADGLSVIVLGDLNHEPTTPEYAAWTDGGLKDVFGGPAVKGLMTWPSDEPQQRIDYIWVDGPLAESRIEAEVLSDGAFRPDPNPHGFPGLSDHLPVLATFSRHGASDSGHRARRATQ